MPSCARRRGRERLPRVPKLPCMRRFLVLVGICFAALLIAAAAMVQRAANARMTELAAWARRAEADWRLRDFARDAISGSTSADSAFAHYREAMARTERLGGNVRDRLRDLRSKPALVPPDEAAALLDRYAPALAVLRAGAHSRDARPAVDWRAGYSHHVFNLLVARDLVHAAVLTQQRLRAAGSELAAVELLLSAATFGCDLLHAPTLIDQMVGVSLLTAATCDALADEDLQALSPAGLRALAEGLARLDARCPATLDFSGEALLAAHAMLQQQSPYSVEARGTAWQAWRQGFSWRLARAETALVQAELAAELAATAALPWPQRQRHIEGMIERCRPHQNPILAVAIPNLVSAEEHLRLVMTRLRLLRCAVACHLGEVPPQLADPFGTGPLVCKQVGSGMHFESVGAGRLRPIERRVAGD